MTWRRVRERILARDNRTCQFCFDTESRLDIHHITSRTQGGDDMPENLITLCSFCHARISRPTKYGLPLAVLIQFLAQQSAIHGVDILPLVFEISSEIGARDLYLNDSGELCVSGSGIVAPQAKLLRFIATANTEASD